MATTAVEICNLALDNVGVTNKIAALADSSKEAKACNRWYATIRDLVLRAYPWPFAARLVALVQDETETNADWSYLYTRPADYLKARRVIVAGQPRNTLRLPFEASVLNAAGTAYLIGCDTAEAYLDYTRKMDTDAHVTMFPPAFVDALAFKLATRLVVPLSLDKGLIKEAETMYKSTAAEAYADSIDEIAFDQQQDAPWIQGRG